MSMGWNSSHSTNGKGGDERPDLVSTLVRVEALKGEAGQLEKANKLAQAKAKLVEAMEMIITIRSTLNGNTDKACVDGILRGLIEEGERLQLLLRLDRLSHAWQQEKDSQPLTERSTSEPVGKQDVDDDDADDKAMIDLIPTPPSDTIQDIKIEKEEKGIDEGQAKDVPQEEESGKGIPVVPVEEEEKESGKGIPVVPVEEEEKEEESGKGIPVVPVEEEEKEEESWKGIPVVPVEDEEKASELKDDNIIQDTEDDSLRTEEEKTEEERDVINHSEHHPLLPTSGDVTLTDNSSLSPNKGTVSFELSESEDGDNPSGIESSVLPTNTTRLSTISASILMEDDLGSILSYDTMAMSPILLNPSGAPRSGGTRFSIGKSTGDSSVDLNNISYLKIGGRPCAEVAPMIEGQREFLAPLSRGPPGPADVVVVMEDVNDSFIIREAFEYFDKARLMDIEPTTLPYSKEATVMVEVTNLSGRCIEGIEVRRGGDNIVDGKIKTITGKSVLKGAPSCTIIKIALPSMEEKDGESNMSIKVIGRAGNIAEGINCLHLYQPMVFNNTIKGSRIKLEDDGITAIRRNGINNAVVFSKYPLKRLPISNSLPFGAFYYSITITNTATAMKTFAFGLTTIDPSRNLPSGRLEEDAITTLSPRLTSDAAAAAACSLLVGYDPVRLWLNGKSYPISSKDWRPAKQVSIGDSIGILFTFDKVIIYQNGSLRVQLAVDDNDACFMRNHLPNNWWGVVDIMGKVSGVRLNGDDLTPPSIN